MMKTKIVITVFVSILLLIVAIGIGSVAISPTDIIRIFLHQVFGVSLPTHFSQITEVIVWDLRVPRVLLAFIVGAALSVSGAIMQSILKNPLASSYTLGVSSGASLGAGIVILFGFTVPLFDMFTLPMMGFVFGLATIFLVIGFTSKIDRRLENNTIILTGMILSLFVNAVVTMLMALAQTSAQQLIFWQMGSFSSKNWTTVDSLVVISFVSILFASRYHREMDMMTFGEEQARVMGVPVKRLKLTLLMIASALTGSAISFVGVIGFVDLMAPHVVRKIFGSRHKLVIPMSGMVGGCFMVVCDLVARTMIPAQEIPVGVVSALIGTPFFAYVYFKKRAKVRGEAT